MPPRPSLPRDDLYARLELPTDATPEAVEIAWRALLRRHHPDIAGPNGLEHSKRINVAHDWLGDPGLRARYDRERGLHGSPIGRAPRRGGRWHDDRAAATATPIRRRPHQPEDLIARFLERVGALSSDELDRLEAADPTPIAFGATIRRFVSDDLRVALEALEAKVARRLSPSAAARPCVRDTIDAYAAELVLGRFLDELLSEPFRARARERLTRGWDAAVGQPRYGPNGRAVRDLLGRLRVLDPGAITALAAGGSRGRLGEDPWPPGTSPDDDEALRVSSVLAARDAAAAVAAAYADASAAAGAPTGRPGLDRTTVARAGRIAGRIAHLLVLRHAFAPAAFDGLTAPWRPRLVPDDLPAPSVRRPSPA
jgi:molecular chaperone DnaJ